MLLAGTTQSLWDVERSYALAEDACVTALAGRSGRVWALFDRERIELVETFDVEPLAVLRPADGESLVALADGRLVVGRQGATLAVAGPEPGAPVTAIAAFDHVPGRESWHNPAAATPSLRSLASDDGGRLFANVHVGGLWRSDDAGSHWEQAIPPEADVHEVAAGVDGKVVVAAAEGFGWSTDRGQTWSWTVDGLHAPYARAVASSGEAVYVTASTGPNTTKAALYRAPAAGRPFTKCAGGLPEWFASNLDTGQVSADGDKVALGTSGGELWLSQDGGGRFEKVAADLGVVTTVLFA